MSDIAFQTVSQNGGSGVDLQSAAAVKLSDGNIVLLTTKHGLENNETLNGNTGDTFVKQVDGTTGEENGQDITAPFAMSSKYDLALVDIPDNQIPESEVTELAPEDSLKPGDQVTGDELLTDQGSRPETKPATVESTNQEEGTVALNETNEHFEQGNSGGSILNKDNGELVALVQGSETHTITGASGTQSDRDGKAVDLTNPMVRQEVNNLASQIAIA